MGSSRNRLLIPSAILGALFLTLLGIGAVLDAILVALASVLLLLNYPLVAIWVRSRRWPVVGAAIEHQGSSDPISSWDSPRWSRTHHLQLSYEFEGQRYFRSATADRHPEGNVAIRVNPADPAETFLELTSPYFSLTIFAAVFAFIVFIALGVLAA